MELRLRHKKKIFFSIIGLPRSGTTLVSNIFNSCTNAFSISEPHWAFMRFKNNLSFGKIEKDFKPYWNNDIINILPALNTFLHQEKYDVGGFKETYNSTSKRINYITDELINIIIFVYRNPLYCFNSQKKENPCQNVKALISEYNKFTEFHDSVKQKTYTIDYEKVCEDKEKYLNIVFSDILKFDKIKLEKNNFILGDNKAHCSTDIGNAVKETNSLSSKEIEHIEKELKCT